MRPDLEERRGNGPVHLSPSRMAVLSAVFVCTLTAIPANVYETALAEPNFMRWDLLTYGFVAACLVSFLIGAAAFRPRVRGGKFDYVRVYSDTSWFPAGVAVFSAVVAVAALVNFVGAGGTFTSALVSGQGEALRSAARESAAEGVTPLTVLPIGVPLLVWSIFRTTTLQRRRKLIYGCAVVYGVVLLLVLQRNLLIPFVLSVAVVLSGTRLHVKGITFARAVKAVVAIGVFVIAIFAAVAFFRGTGNDSITTSFMGYVPASVNRLAATLHGHYTSQFSGQPAFTFRFLWYPPLIRRFLPMPEIMQMFNVSVPTDATLLWSGEFTRVASGGLNPLYIWPTAFGYAFYDFSWYACFYFFALGILANFAWRMFLRRTAFGIVFYSYVASSIALWGTDNFLSYPQMWLYVFAIAFIWMFDPGRRAWTPSENAVGLSMDAARMRRVAVPGASTINEGAQGDDVVDRSAAGTP